MKIVVKSSACTGHARCNAAAPEVYELDDAGYLAVTEIVVPAGMEEAASEGADMCPERAITITIA
jgi:ferredoxin